VHVEHTAAMCCRRRHSPKTRRGASFSTLLEEIGDTLDPETAQATYSDLQRVLDAALVDASQLDKSVKDALHPDAVRVLLACGFAPHDHGGLVLEGRDSLQQVQAALNLVDCLILSYAEEGCGEPPTSAVLDSQTPEGPDRTADAESGGQRPRAVADSGPEQPLHNFSEQGDTTGDTTSVAPFPNPSAGMSDKEVAHLLQDQPRVLEFERFSTENVVVDPTAVEEINRHCLATGDKFVDPQFPPSIRSLYLSDREAELWQCLSCQTFSKLPSVPPLPSSREELAQQEAIFRETVKCSGCGSPAPYITEVRYFTRPTQWLRPGVRCEGCELFYGSVSGGTDLLPQMCPHFIRDSMSQLTIGSPWKLIREEARPEDVCQGGLGNCWFAGALSVVAQMSHLIDNLFITKEFNPFGAYHMQLFHAGEWRGMLLDDLLPTSQISEGYLDGQMIYFSRGGTLCYLQGARRQLWVPLVEKAAAKLFGSFGALKGGTFGEALGLFTGYPTDRIKLYESKAARQLRERRRDAARLSQMLGGLAEESDGESDDLTWSRLLSCKDAGYLMGMGCTEEGCEKTKEHIVDEMGLQAPHAYGILDVREVVVEGQLVRLMKIRNPWGERAPRTWRGDWGKDSPKWTDALKRDLCVTNSSGVLMDDPMSIFWMSYEDVKEYFAAVEICRVRWGWYETRCKGWLPSALSPGDAFQLTVFRRTAVDLVLWQERNLSREGAVGARSTNVDVGFAVLRDHGPNLEGRPTYELIEHVQRACFDDINFEMILEGGFAYRIVPLCCGLLQDNSRARSVILAVHALQDVKLEKVPSSWYEVACSLVAGAQKHGHRWREPSGLSFWLSHEPGGSTLVAENDSSRPSAVQVDASESLGCISSRGSLGITVTIPARRQMLLMGLGFSPSALYTRVSVLPQPVPLEMAPPPPEAEDLHMPLAKPSFGRAQPDASILQRAPLERPPPPPGSRQPPAVPPRSGPGTKEPQDHVAPPQAPPCAHGSDEENDDDVAIALKLSLELNRPTSRWGPRPALGSSAMRPGSEQREARVKELFALNRARGLPPNEAAAVALEQVD